MASEPQTPKPPACVWILPAGLVFQVMLADAEQQQILTAEATRILLYEVPGNAVDSLIAPRRPLQDFLILWS